MKLLSRPEELVLLTVWRLKENAYSVRIREQLMRDTRKKWSFGAVYDPLDRLVKKSMLDSYLTDPTPERGGKSKRIYTLSDKGKQALLEIKQLEETMWAGIQLVDLKEGL